MGYYCTVPQCTSLAGKTKNVKFHRFPRDESLADKWNLILKRNKPYTKYSKVCSLHFTQGDYNLTTMGKKPGQWKTLAKDALPTQNLPKVNADGTVMVIRKSRSLKYKAEPTEVKREREDGIERQSGDWANTSASSTSTSSPGCSSANQSLDTSDSSFQYRLNSLNAIANNVSPAARPVAQLRTVLQQNKPPKQDAMMQTDPPADPLQLSEDEERMARMIKDKEMQRQRDLINQDLHSKMYAQKSYDDPKNYTKDQFKDNEDYNKEAESYALERTSKRGDNAEESQSYGNSPENYRQGEEYETSQDSYEDQQSSLQPETYQKQQESYPKQQETYTRSTECSSPSQPYGTGRDFPEYQKRLDPYATNYVTTSADILRNQQHNLQMLQQHSNRMAEQLSSRIAEDHGNRMAEQLTNRVAEDHSDRMTERLTDRMTEEHASRISGQLGNRMVEELSNRMAKEHGNSIADQVTNRMADEHSSRIAEEMSNRLVEQHSGRLVEQQGNAIAEAAGFYTNRIKEELDLSNEEETFLTYENVQKEDAYTQSAENALFTQQQRHHLLQQQQRLMEQLQHQHMERIKTEPDMGRGGGGGGGGGGAAMQQQPSPLPYYREALAAPDAAYYGQREEALAQQQAAAAQQQQQLFSQQPGAELLIAKQNALAAHTTLWQNSMKRPFFYSEAPQFNTQLHARYEDLTRLLNQ